MYQDLDQMSHKSKCANEEGLQQRSFSLVENQDISRKWLYSQTLSYACATISGLFCAYTLRVFRNLFYDSCLLNIEFNFHDKDGSNVVQAVFGTTTLCDFCEFVPVVASISAIVLAMYFIMSGRGGKGSPGFLPRPWRIVIPALIFNIIAFIFVIVATSKLHGGLHHFCEQLLGKQLELNRAGKNATSTDIDVNTNHGFRTLSGCRVDLNVSVPITTSDSHNPLHAITPAHYALLEISEVASWINVGSWGLAALITLLRLLFFADFKLVRFDFFLKDIDEHPVPPSSSSMCSAEGDVGVEVHATSEKNEGEKPTQAIYSTESEKHKVL